MKVFKNWYFPDTEEHFIKYLEQHSTDEYQKEQRLESFKYLDKKRNAIDIGANIGLWAKDFCKIFNSVKLFEPYMPNIECLKKNLEDFNNFKIYEYALSNKNGFNKLYIDEKGLGGNTLRKIDLFTKTEEIKIKKLDNFDFKNVDYIKIDVQFHELEVIEGSILTLKNNNPVLCIESSRRNEEELNYVKKIVKILDSLGYRIVGKMRKELFFKR